MLRSERCGVCSPRLALFDNTLWANRRSQDSFNTHTVINTFCAVSYWETHINSGRAVRGETLLWCVTEEFYLFNLWREKRERNLPKAEKCWPDTHVQLSNNILERVFLVGKLCPLLPLLGAGRARSWSYTSPLDTRFKGQTPTAPLVDMQTPFPIKKEAFFVCSVQYTFRATTVGFHWISKFKGTFVSYLHLNGS